MAILTYGELRDKTEKELIVLYDEKAMSTDLGITPIRDELFRRELDKQQRQVLRLTYFVAGLTVLYTVFAGVQLWKM